MARGEDVLVVMAKYPRAGRVKTRLARAFGAATVCRLYAAFLADIARRFEDQAFALVWAVDPPQAGMHLIVCRNVLIYFDRSTQETLFQRFFDALAPGGYLVLGKVETLLGPTRSLFSAVDPRERIFRRR